MRIKDIAKKYGIEYQIVYHGMGNAGLIHYGKNKEYDELGAIAATSQYLFSRIDRHKEKICADLKMIEQINSVLKKERQK